jgi:hypothetical protein
MRGSPASIHTPATPGLDLAELRGALRRRLTGQADNERHARAAKCR